MTDFQDKVVVITGASSGIGEATARALYAQGAKVMLGARRGDRLKEIANGMCSSRVAWAEADIRSVEQVRNLFTQAEQTFGRVDCLVANAGVGAYGGILDLNDAQVQELIDTNVTGTIWCVRSAVPLMLAQGGDIILVSSVAGLRGKAEEAVYAATKHAVIGLAGSMDRELRQAGIRVIAMCPGATATEFAMGQGRHPGMPQLQDMMRPHDVAEAIVYAIAQPRTMRTLVWSMRSASSEN